MMTGRAPILQIASDALQAFLEQTRRHEDDVADMDAAAALIEVVTRFMCGLVGPVPILRLINRVLAEQRQTVPEVREAAAERQARAALAVPSGGKPAMSELVADLRKALDEAYPEKPARLRRRKQKAATKKDKSRPSWCRGVIQGGLAEGDEA